MKRIFSFSTLLVLSILILVNCDKESNVSGEVELFLLESFATLDQSCAIDQSAAVLKNEPLISYSEFSSYNSEKHVFTISDKAALAVENLEHSVFGLPFAVVANHEIAYTGYFWPAYSSLTCQWIIIDPLMVHGKNELPVVLGYPGPIEGTNIPEERNNKLILDIFNRDGKLID